jgi:prepilin-type N-terminal cleavage/methylation domain-containing protein
MKYRNAGFTFIEILVATGVIALISGVSAQVFLAASRNAVKSDLIRNIKQNGEYSLESMSRMIQSAKSISACTGAPSGSFAIKNADDGVTTFGCVLDGTVTRIASGSAIGTAYLTTAGLTLGGATCAQSSLTFLCTPNAGLPSRVRINFSLSQIGNPVKNYEKATVPFQTTVTMRSDEPL